MKTRGRIRAVAGSLAIAATVLALPLSSTAYSVLSHEQVVDECWKPIVVPMLLRRFPGLTPDQIAEAHSYAYGGSVIQDVGYYPHGSHEMSDLLHYVRTGDFVQNLLADATTADEFAFAIGSLAHYDGDIIGHPQATNVVTAMQYPQLEAKYGSHVTYYEDPTAHVRTEFGFDVVEVAQGKFQEDAYRDFIGFRVATDLLNRAFLDTYGISVQSLVNDENRSINTYRHDVSTVIPEATRIAWATYKKQIVAAEPTATERKFQYRLSNTAYERAWGGGYQQPTAKEKFLAFIVRILPKIGPLKALKLKLPTQQEQDIYRKSLLAVVAQYKSDLAQLGPDGNPGRLKLAGRDLDTGRPTEPGEYELADTTYAKLTEQLTAPNMAPPLPDLRANILAFYGNDGAPDKNFVAKDPAAWAKVQASLQQLRAEPAVKSGQ